MSALVGKQVLLTGATSGIGRATLDRLLVAGATVLAVGRDPARAAALGRADRVIPLAADLASPEAVERLLEAVRGRGRPVDALINDAAECLYESPLGLAPGRWRRLFDVNLIAPVLLLRGLVELMPSGGTVVQLSSVNARGSPNARFAAYGATKAALAHVSSALRAELGSRGIRVCQVTPGLVDTELYRKVEGFEGAARKLKQAVPRWLDAGDVAEAIVWVLAQPAHVTVGEVVLLPTGQA